MDEEALQSRISQITTRWSLLEQAHGSSERVVASAQAEFLRRYHAAVFRYLAASLRNLDSAEDVFQEFATKFVSGGFRGADPARGRFRSYLKTALARLVIDFRRRKQREGQRRGAGLSQMEDDEQVAHEESRFDLAWRAELLNRTWEKLAVEQKQGGQPFFTALKFRADHPGAASAEIATALSEQLDVDKPYTPAGARKLLQRARQRFADLLLDEVASSPGCSDRDSVEAELVELGLLDYCRSAIDRRRTE